MKAQPMKAQPMNRATPQMRTFAKRIMGAETGGTKSYDAKIMLGFHVCEKLHRHMASFMGSTGFRALLTRALVLAAAEVPWLGRVRVEPDLTLTGLEKLPPDIGPDELFEGGVTLLAHLLGLMVAFIGEMLTVRLVHEVWPKVPLADLSFEAEGQK